MPSWRRSILFFLVVLFLCGWHIDDGPNANTMSRAATVASLLDRGTLEITPIHEVTGDKALIGGRYYSEKAPLPTFLVLPFHALAMRTGLAPLGEHGSLTKELLRLGGFICGSIPLALIITLVWRRMASASKVPADPALLAALPFFGSFLFVYSGSFYNHLLGSLFILLGAWSHSARRSVWTGIWSGLAFLTESALILFPIAWCLRPAIMRRWREIGLLLLGLLPAILLMGWYNWSITGLPWVFPNAYHVNFEIMAQGYGFGTWRPEAFWHLLISDHRGLLFYMPFLVMALWILPRHMRFSELIGDPFVLPALLLIAAFLTHATWWGGWTYGPRYIMASAVLLAVAVLQRSAQEQRMKMPFFLLTGFGVLCALAAKSTIQYSMPTHVKHPMIEEVWPRIIRGDLTHMQWPVWLGLSPALATLLFFVAFLIGLWLLVRLDRDTPDNGIVLRS